MGDLLNASVMLSIQDKIETGKKERLSMKLEALEKLLKEKTITATEYTKMVNELQ